MRSRTLLFATLMAAALAAASCGGKGESASNPSTSGGVSSQQQEIYGEPFTCGGWDNESVALLIPDPQNPARTVTFDLASFVAPGFPTTYTITENVGGQMRTTAGGSPDRATIACDSVISLEDYVIAQGNGIVAFGSGGGGLNADRVFGDFPDSVAYIFKKSASSLSGLDFIGAAPDFGSHKKFLVLKNYGNAGDLLIAASEARWARSATAGSTAYYPENNQMLNAMAQALGFEDFNDGNETSERVVWVNGVAIRRDQPMSTQELIRKAMELSNAGFDMNAEIRFEETTTSFKLYNGITKIAIYWLPVNATPYSPNAKPLATILKKAAARPLVLGNFPKLEQMELVLQGGEPYLKLAARVEGKGTVRTYASARLSDVLGGAAPGEVTVATEESRYFSPQLVPIKEILEHGQAWTTPLLK